MKDGATIGDFEAFNSESDEEFKKIRAGMLKYAVLQRVRYETLIEVGFNEEQALEMCQKSPDFL